MKCCYQRSRKIFPTSHHIKMHPNDLIFVATKPSHSAISLAGNKQVYLTRQWDFHDVILFSVLPGLTFKVFLAV